MLKDAHVAIWLLELTEEVLIRPAELRLQREEWDILVQGRCLSLPGFAVEKDPATAFSLIESQM